MSGVIEKDKTVQTTVKYPKKGSLIITESERALRGHRVHAPTTNTPPPRTFTGRGLPNRDAGLSARATPARPSRSPRGSSQGFRRRAENGQLPCTESRHPAVCPQPPLPPPACPAGGSSLATFTCFSEGLASFPWAALHSRAISAYFSFSSSLRSWGVGAGATGRSGSEDPAPWPSGDAGHCRAAVRPGPAQGPPSPSGRPKGSPASSWPRPPPPRPRTCPTARPSLTPSSLPPSQRSSRGWHQPREPRAGLGPGARGSSPAQRNSRHSGWPCGSAWRACADLDAARRPHSRRRPRRAPALSN